MILGSSISFPILYILFHIENFSIELNHTKIMLLSLVFSLIGYFCTYKMIPYFIEKNKDNGFKGVDINKVEDIKNLKDPNRKEVAESLGIVPSTVFLVVSILSQLFMGLKSEGQLEYNASLLSICFMIFLGFADDSLDLRWRYKLVLPLIAGIPLVVVYNGATNIILPKIIGNILGFTSIELGIIYKIYMIMLAIFCTNSINIYAGINGLEVGQSLIISLSIILYNLIGIVRKEVDENLFSFTIMLPFFFCSLGLFMYNKYPSQCFIGDTFCYFAGMTFACAGILGHFSKTILLFFIPQIINFVVSLPQLLGFIPIARHRLPKFSAKTKKLTGQPEHYNLLNISLRILGPQREQDICNYLLILQIICSVLALYLRFFLLSI